MRTAAAAVIFSLLAAASALAQSQEAGRRQYESLCTRLHGSDGHGGEMGPAIVLGLAAAIIAFALVNQR